MSTPPRNPPDRPSAAARARAVFCLAALSLFGCDQRSEGPAAPAVVPGTPARLEAPARSASGAREPSLPPTSLLTIGLSAYSATMAVDEDAVYALTPAAAFRMVPGRPPEQRQMNLGVSPILDADRIVYWSDGALRSFPTRGGQPTSMAQVPHQPQRIAASEGRVVWLDQADDGRFTLRTPDGSRERIAHAPSGHVAALAMQGDHVFFVERATPTRWRLGSVALSSGATRFTPYHSGRTPAMLAVASEIFYYDGPTGTIRRVAPDLAHEEVVARDIICSPMAVAKHIYCAQPGALLEVSFDGTVRRRLPRRGTITAIAAGVGRLAWALDAGEDRMAIETLPFSPSTGGLP